MSSPMAIGASLGSASNTLRVGPSSPHETCRPWILTTSEASGWVVPRIKATKRAVDGSNAEGCARGASPPEFPPARSEKASSSSSSDAAASFED